MDLNVTRKATTDFIIALSIKMKVLTKMRNGIEFQKVSMKML